MRTSFFTSGLLLLGITAGLGLFTSEAHADGAKMAVIDMQYAIIQTNEGKAENERLKERFDKKQSGLDKREKRLLKDKGRLEKRCSRHRSSSCEKDIQEFQNRAIEYEKARMAFQKEVQTEQKAVTERILSKMLGIVRRIAEQKKVDIVIDRSVTHYLGAGLDFTTEAIQTYDKESKVPPPKAPANKAAKPKTK
jgi:outer membrane protein